MVTYFNYTIQRAGKMKEIDGGKLSKVRETYRSLCEIFSIPLSIQRVKERMARRVLEKVPINAVDEWGRTLLILACLDNKQDIVGFLLESYSEVISLDRCDRKGNTALHYACMGGRKPLIAKLMTEMINKGVTIKKVNKEGMTAGDLALRNSNIDAAEIIIKELYGNRLGGKFAVPNLFITEKHHAFNDQSLKHNPARKIGLPSIWNAKCHESFKEVGSYPPTVIPKFDPRKTSKAICSRLLALRSIQDTVAYRQGFPLISGPKKDDSTRRESSSSRYRTLSPIVPQTGVESRRGSLYRGSIVISITAEESAGSSSKTIHTRKFHNMNKPK